MGNVLLIDALAPAGEGVIAEFASTSGAYAFRDEVLTLVNPLGTAAGQYTVVPAPRSFAPAVIISVDIENAYELYDEVATRVLDLVVAAPTGDDLNGTTEWAYDHLHDLTGVGHPDGDAWHDLTVTASSDPAIIPIGQHFDFGY
jgi:hypothetical protein